MEFICVIEHFFAELRIFLNHVDGHKLIVKHSIDAAFNFLKIVGERSRVYHIV